VKSKPYDRHNQNIFTKSNTINMQKSGNKMKSISRIFSALIALVLFEAFPDFTANI